MTVKSKKIFLGLEENRSPVYRTRESGYLLKWGGCHDPGGSCHFTSRDHCFFSTSKFNCLPKSRQCSTTALREGRGTMKSTPGSPWLTIKGDSPAGWSPLSTPSGACDSACVRAGTKISRREPVWGHNLCFTLATHALCSRSSDPLKLYCVCSSECLLCSVGLLMTFH